MFKKFTALMLMIAFVSGMVCLSGCDSKKSSSSSSSSDSSSSSAKINNSSKEALAKSFIDAVKNEDVDAVFACLDAPSQKYFKEEAKAKKMTEKEFVKKTKEEMLEAVTEEYNGDMDKFIAGTIKEWSEGNMFVEKNGKWYLHLADDDDLKTTDEDDALVKDDDDDDEF